MKALVCRHNGPFDQLVLDQAAPVPQPGPGEVLVRVHAAAITFVDALQVLGRYQLRVEPPFIPGCELAGTIERIGAGVGELASGMRVVAVGLHGAFAEYAVVGAEQCMVVGDDVALPRAVDTAVAYTTALHALHDRAGLAKGERLLVLGAGGRLGLAAVDIGRALGATVIGAAADAAKREAALRQGASKCIDYSQPDWHRAARALVPGESFDVVFDPVGGDYSEPALRTLGFRGRHLIIGFTAGAIPRLPTNLVLLMERIIAGVNFGLLATTDPAALRSIRERVFRELRDGTLRPLEPRVFRLEDVPAVLQQLTERRFEGKAVVEMR